MSVLAYCITELDSDIHVPRVGVHGSSIQTIEESGLRCFISIFSGNMSKPAREAALVFSGVLQAIFEQVAIIPFRFPTLVDGEGEIRKFICEHAVRYREELARLRNFVQMEVQISCAESNSQAPGSTDPMPQPSHNRGTAYLRERQLRYEKLALAAEEFRRAGKEYIHQWRARDVRAGVRAYALVDRSATGEFLEAVKAVRPPSDLRARITGPWPATEFLKEANVER
jgi:Gas vesicle synthesis protein GvpL/GvpF